MFDDTEARQLRLTAALRDIEAAYRLYAGRGMPSGVEIVQAVRRAA